MKIDYSRSIASLAMIAIICVLAIPQAAQSKLPPQMVILNVRVTDQEARAVADVSQERFVVTEDGVPQKISLFLNQEIPLSYGLLIDSSGSLRSQFPAIVETAGRIIISNKPADETFLIRFISSDKIETVQETTSDKALLLRGVESLYIEGGATAVIDAVYLGADHLGKQKIDPNNVRRRVLILVTDGEDRNSYYKKEQLLQLLASVDIQVFIIGFTKDLHGDKHNKAVSLLTRLATDTGGRVFFPSSIVELNRISSEIINDIRTQYVIGYVPSEVEPKKGFHKVQVSITDSPDQQKRVAVTRVGYGTPGK